MIISKSLLILLNCDQYLHNKRDPVFLIISGSCATQCLPRIHNLPAIDSIFIYCASPSKYKKMIDTNTKVVSCVSTERELLNQVHWWTELKCSTQFYTCGNGFKRLTRDSSLFLAYFLVLNGIPDGSTKEDMVDVCRAYYAENTIENENINEFEINYTQDQAIAWYTKSTFVYKMLKKTLRLFDLNKLYAFAFYIRDLQNQLENWHYTSSKTFFVYRGLTMSLVNIAQLQANVGNLVAPNGFLSTSRTRDIAMNYARKQTILEQGDNFCNVLLEIEIGTDVSSSCIFADVSHVSAFPEEQEILFSIGTIFRINEVSLSSQTGIYIIKMKTANCKEYALVDKLLTIAREKFDEHTNQQLILKLLQYAQSFSRYQFNFDRSWTWSDIKNGMYATSHRAVKALISGAYRFTRTNYLQSNTTTTLEITGSNNIEPGFCFYSGTSILHTRLRTDVDDDKNWISSGEFIRILASSDFQEYPRTYFVISNVQLPSYLLILGSKWLHIYYNNGDDDDEVKFDQVYCQFIHDLAQYYREIAQRILREQNDREKAKLKILLAHENSTRTISFETSSLFCLVDTKSYLEMSDTQLGETAPLDLFDDQIEVIILDQNGEISNAEQQLKPFGSIVKIIENLKVLKTLLKNKSEKTIIFILILPNGSRSDVIEFLINEEFRQQSIHSFYLFFINGEQHEAELRKHFPQLSIECYSITERRYDEIQMVLSSACDLNIKFCYRQAAKEEAQDNKGLAFIYEQQRRNLIILQRTFNNYLLNEIDNH
ncbi:unnamed protein product [Rotaria sp. Silwood1]|nr:unnamed protein product [Rotaria sp. Silwood1]